MIIGLVGFKAAGKDTVANYLIENSGEKWTRESFASSLKDSLASVFQWDRAMLEGDTEESREWRETVDEWWANKLDMPDFTPRIALQRCGTDLWRNKFHDDIWLLSVEKKLTTAKHNVIITDTRFPNEIKLIKELGGKIVRVRRGPEPEWWNTAVADNAEREDPMHELMMPMVYPNVHESEYAWVGCNVDYVVDNGGTLEQLRERVKNLEQGPLASMVYRDPKS